MGSLVTFFDIDNDVEKGTVRWIGNNKKVIGIEAVSCTGYETLCHVFQMMIHLVYLLHTLALKHKEILNIVYGFRQHHHINVAPTCEILA